MKICLRNTINKVKGCFGGLGPMDSKDIPSCSDLYVRGEDAAVLLHEKSQ